MSALSYICDEYGSDSEDCETDNKDIEINRSKFPVPNLSKVPVVPSDTHIDDPQLHGGRSRSFPHVRGNWATFVYVNYSQQTDAVCDLIDKLEEVIVTKVDSCHRCDDFHISLSKTFVLKYHLISTFQSSLHKCLTNVERCSHLANGDYLHRHNLLARIIHQQLALKYNLVESEVPYYSFDLGFAAVKVYCNEDRSRTFIALDVDPFTHKHLLNVSKKLDDVLTEFLLPTFYENPFFHMSVLWVNGDKKSELDSILDILNEILYQEIEKSLETVLIETIHCKSGNKYFQYSLS